ncbi:MAG: hypothetical protein AAF940_10225 [Pseudomonadota bacterium]
MQETLFILTVLGCNGAVTECRTIQSEQVQYATVDECYARSEALIVANAAAPYPVFLAHCDAADSVGQQVAARPAFTPDQSVAVTTRPERMGIWYRVPVAQTVTDAASSLIDGAGNIAASIGERVEIMARRTSQTVRRLNPF